MVVLEDLIFIKSMIICLLQRKLKIMVMGNIIPHHGMITIIQRVMDRNVITI